MQYDLLINLHPILSIKNEDNEKRLKWKGNLKMVIFSGLNVLLFTFHVVLHVESFFNVAVAFV